MGKRSLTEGPAVKLAGLVADAAIGVLKNDCLDSCSSWDKISEMVIS